MARRHRRTGPAWEALVVELTPPARGMEAVHELTDDALNVVVTSMEDVGVPLGLRIDFTVHASVPAAIKIVRLTAPRVDLVLTVSSFPPTRATSCTAPTGPMTGFPATSCT